MGTPLPEGTDLKWLEFASSLASAFFGGAVALVGKSLIEKWKAPKLNIITPGVLVPNDGEYWGRVCITNTGRSAAKKGRILAKFKDKTNTEQIFDMGWSDISSKDFRSLEMPIPSKTGRYCDIFYIKGPDKIHFEAYNNPIERPFNNFTLTLFATAENAETVTRDLLFSTKSVSPWMDISADPGVSFGSRRSGYGVSNRPY